MYPHFYFNLLKNFRVAIIVCFLHDSLCSSLARLGFFGFSIFFPCFPCFLVFFTTANRAVSSGLLLLCSIGDVAIWFALSNLWVIAEIAGDTSSLFHHGTRSGCLITGRSRGWVSTNTKRYGPLAIETNYNLVGCFLTASVIHYPAMRSTLANLWHSVKVIEILDIGEKRFLFRFFHQMDLDRVLKGAHWTFNNHLLVFMF